MAIVKDDRAGGQGASNVLTEQQEQALVQRVGDGRSAPLLDYVRERVPIDTETGLRVTANPLMLSMFASVFELRTGLPMPSTVVGLYKMASDVMLSRSGAASGDVPAKSLAGAAVPAPAQAQAVATSRALGVAPSAPALAKASAAPAPAKGAAPAPAVPATTTTPTSNGYAKAAASSSAPAPKAAATKEEP